MSLRTRLRDWWRGYSDADVRSVRAKLTGHHKPGGVIWMTPAEMRAMRSTALVLPA